MQIIIYTLFILYILSGCVAGPSTKDITFDEDSIPEVPNIPELPEFPRDTIIEDWDIVPHDSTIIIK